MQRTRRGRRSARRGNLRQKKIDAEDARFWVTCLDWFLQLPPEREQAITRELDRPDKEDNVGIVSILEARGMEKGMEKGRLEALGWYLQAKYGQEALAWLSVVEKISDEAQLKDLCERVFLADSAEKVRALLLSSADPGLPLG